MTTVYTLYSVQHFYLLILLLLLTTLFVKLSDEFGYFSYKWGIILKAHAGEVTAVACAQGVLESTGKDDMISVFSCDQGEYQFLRLIALEQLHFTSAIDVLDGKIAIGYDNGKIQTVNVDGSSK